MEGVVPVLPSEILRYNISKEIGYDLTRFAWRRDLRKEILETNLDLDLETYFSTMEDIFEQGLNVTSNILTCKYISRCLPDAQVCIGFFIPVAGYGCSTRGEHAWLIMDDYVIDPTLMVEIPIEIAKCIGYDFKFMLNKQSSTVISPGECYLRKIQKKKQKDSPYEKTLYLGTKIQQAM